MDKLAKIMLIGTSFAVGIGLFLLSFTSFNTIVVHQILGGVIEGS